MLIKNTRPLIVNYELNFLKIKGKKNVFVTLQVFQTSSEKIESACLAAVTALTSCLSRSVLNSSSEDFLCTFLDLVLTGDLLILAQEAGVHVLMQDFLKH